MQRILSFVIGIFLSFHSIAQNSPFTVYIEPYTINGLGGLQSYAYGQANGKWLIVGGRLDGLHRRQANAAFDVAGNNNQIWVVDPVAATVWSKPLNSLSIALQEQLSSTNMAFYQTGNYLYLLGGYGYSNASASKKTFNQLGAIDVPNTINAIMNNLPFDMYFRTVQDTAFGVTGGHLKKINNTYYLAGGNRFDGNYNPMGGASYTQAYTNAVRRFNIIDNGINISINHQPAWINANEFHRRDYNAVAQILPNGQQGVTLFSGVFQPTIDLPYLGSVTCDSLGYAPDANFQQYYNHYHCGVLPVYSAGQQQMHTVFFGGIAQYYDNGGALVQDNLVPFVKTIARVTRNANGSMSEFKLPIELPNYLGSGAELILMPGLPEYSNHVIKLDDLTADTTLVGHIYGGISSTAPNIFMSNDGTQSTAHNGLFKVYIIKNKPSGVDQLNELSNGTLQLQAQVVRGKKWPILHAYLKQASDVQIRILQNDGKTIHRERLKRQASGPLSYSLPDHLLASNTVYVILVETEYEKASLKIQQTDQ
jgi:hypothetical protein